MIRSRESALVDMIPSHALAVQLAAQKAGEIAKGCERTIWPQPVALEPPYAPMQMGRRTEERKEVLAGYEEPYKPGDLLRLRIWISLERTFDWTRCESFLKQLSAVSYRLVFEIGGNHDGVFFNFGCHRMDLPTVQTAFEAKVEHCMLTPEQRGIFETVSGVSTAIWLRDYVPEPPYYHLLTRPGELQDSPYEGLIAALMRLLPPAVGFYQVVFQPVLPIHRWHQNVQFLTDLEYTSKQISGLTMAQRYPQQIPSGALNPTADKLETKAHNDKPFFATAIRIAVAGSPEPTIDLLALTTPMGLFQHGGGRLSALTEADYGRVLSADEVLQMLARGLTYRPGFLLNSDELTGLVHVPPAKLFERWEPAVKLLDPFTAVDVDLSEGIPIGPASVAGTQQDVCISLPQASQHVQVIGRPGTGKSYLLESMILYHISQGHGVAVLDPHGDLVARLLTLIPQEAVNRTIFFNPGDLDWVPLWNPVSNEPGQDIGRMTDDLVAVFRSLVKDWGDRLETILKQGIFALKHIGHTSLLDLSDLLRTGTTESTELKELILQVVQNEVAQQFWRHDYERYRPEEFGPVRHKLSKLLVGGTYAWMLSQPYSKFSLRHIMDNRMVFLADLSTNLGTEVRNLLGGFLLASIHVAALSRSDMPPEERKPFFTYVDEAHRFTTDCLEDMLVETRKFGVHLTLAHQYLRQFTRTQADALSSVGTTIAFSVPEQDSEHLAKAFPEIVKGRDFLRLQNREALVRIGTTLAKIRTPDRPAAPTVNFRDEILERSHQRYCLPVAAVQQLVRHRHCGSTETFSPLVPDECPSSNTSSARYYDEL